MALVSADSPSGFEWGSTAPGATIPFEWTAPTAIAAATVLPLAWGERVPGAPVPLEWSSGERIEAARLPIAGLRRTAAAALPAPAEIVNRRIAAADAAVPVDWRAQTWVAASPLPAAALHATARAFGAPSEAAGSAEFAFDRLLPIEALSAPTAAGAPSPAELGGGTATALLPRIEILLRQLGPAACTVEVLSAGRGAGGAAAGSLAGMRGRCAAGPEFLAAMLLDPSVAGEFAALPGIVAAMRAETLLALLREATVPVDAAARSGSIVGAEALVPIGWRRRKRIRIRRLLASRARQRMLGRGGSGSGR